MTETITAKPDINNLSFDDVLFTFFRSIRLYQRTLLSRTEDSLLWTLVCAASSELLGYSFGCYQRVEDQPSLIDPLMRHIHTCVRDLDIDPVGCADLLVLAHDKSVEWTRITRFPSWTTIAASVHVLELSNTGSNEADAADRVLALLLRLSRMDYALRYYVDAHDRGPNLSSPRGRFTRAIATLEMLAEHPCDQGEDFIRRLLSKHLKERLQPFATVPDLGEKLDVVHSELQRTRVRLLRTLPMDTLIPEPNIPAIDVVLGQMPGYASPETCTLPEAIAFQFAYLELFNAGCTAIDASKPLLTLRERFGVENVPVVVA